MTRLVWGQMGERFYEAGTDRGVLYVSGSDGVAWNGLTSVKESPSGGDPQPFYIDGFKYANIASAEEFVATLEAFSSPLEFDVCDGTASINNGLFVTQQPRKPFNLSYRTKVGNDLDGIDHGYKIHIVYNALAAPSSRDNVTIGDSASPITFSWSISTLPPKITGYRPSAHFVIDSRLTLSSVLTELENILYGTSTTVPRLPDPIELMSMFDAYTIDLLVEQPDHSIVNETIPIVVRATQPLVDTGQEQLWLDTSAVDYSQLRDIVGD